MNMNKLLFLPLCLLPLMAFAQGLSKNCLNELLALPDKKENFVLQDFLKELPPEVAKVKVQMKLPFGKPKPDKITDIGMSVGCLNAFPENPGQIQAMLKDASLEIARKIAAKKGGAKGTEEPAVDGTQAAQKISAALKNANAGSNANSAPKTANVRIALKECDFIFNPEKKFCYDGTAYDKCDGMDYNPATHICSGDIAYRALCNGAQYNPLTQRCGTGNVVEARCGGIWYDALNPNLQCLNNIIYTKCGAKGYDASNPNFRCQNNVIETKCGKNGWYDMSNANLRCLNNVVETKCGANNWYALDSNMLCQNNIVYTKCGDGWCTKCGSELYNYSTHFCYNGKVGKKCGTRPEVFDPDLYECVNGNKIYLKNLISHSGQSYEAVLIGSQTWIAKNLNYAAASGSRCYNNDNSNCIAYGRLYDWAEAKTACPSGWHLPSDAEWTALTNYVESNSKCSGCAGTKLKAANGWSNSNGTDDYGFSALPGGFGLPSNSFGLGGFGLWWSTTESHASNAYARNMDQRSDVSKNSRAKSDLYSVRCLQD